MRILSVILLTMLGLPALGQNAKTMTRVTYHEFNASGQVDNSKLEMHVVEKLSHLSKPDSKSRIFQDFSLRQIVTLASFNEELVVTKTPFEELPAAEFIDSVVHVLDFTCTQARFMYFSNTIDVWFTNESGVQGCPYSRYIAGPDALVLKIVVNGNHTLMATAIEEISYDDTFDYPIDQAETISKAELEEKKIKSRYTVVNVFDQDTINFDPNLPKPAFNNPKIGQVYRFANGGVILKKIRIPESHAKGGYVHAQLTCWSEGDAYDRTGSVFTFADPEDGLSILNAMQDSVGVLPVLTDWQGEQYQGYTKTDNYNPPIELMRFFTSFGAGHFNDLREIHNYEWHNEAVYNQEITELVPLDKKEMWIAVFIANYDAGGHRVSLDLNFYPSFETPDTTKRWVEPLFNTVNVLEMVGQNYAKLFKSDTLTVDFEVHENATNMHLLYTATGHGGWGEGDEFTPHQHTILIDSEVVYSTIPWRTDCATYRLSNPASGNFSNGLSSSDLSRSNWCPATLTPPDRVHLNHLAAGSHTIEIIIDQGPDVEGGFNYWCISGVLVGDEK